MKREALFAETSEMLRRVLMKAFCFFLLSTACLFNAPGYEMFFATAESGGKRVEVVAQGEGYLPEHLFVLPVTI